ncbi:MAG: CHAT domain-containing protein, partial [Candidatus Eremiobacterota bacterium]
LVIKILLKADEAYDMKTLSNKKKYILVQIALEVSEFTGDKASIARSLFCMSIPEVIEKQDYNPPGLQKSLALFKELGDKKGEASCYYRQAKNLYEVFDKKDMALKLLDKSLSVYKESGDELGEGDCYYYKGEIYKRSGDRNKAMDNIKTATDIYKKQGDMLHVICSYSQMADICKSSGLLKEALNYISLEKDLLETLELEKIKDFSGKEDIFTRRTNFTGKEQSLVFIYDTLGDLYKSMGKYEEAIKNYKNAVELSDKINRRSLAEILSYWSLASIYSSLGQKDMALKFYLEAAKKNSDPNMEIYLAAGNYMRIGDYYLKVDPDEAIKYYELASGKFEEIEVPESRAYYKALCILYIGKSYEEKKDFDMAIKKMEEARDITEKIYGYRYDFQSFLCYLWLGYVYQKKGDREHALTSLNKALEMAEGVHDLTGILKVYEGLGAFYLETNDLNRALDNYREALKIAEELQSPASQWKDYFYMGKIYEKQGKLEEAYKAYDNSIGIIENMRHEFKLEELKRDFMQDKIEVYEHMIDLLIKMKRGKDAFYYNEKARARAFLDILANHKVDIRHGVNPELTVKEDELKTQIQYLSGIIRKEKSRSGNTGRNALTDETGKKLKNLKLEYQQVIEDIKLQNPEYMSLISVNPLSPEQIQTLLDKDTVIVEFFLGDSNSYVWIIDCDNFHTVVLNHNRRDIEHSVRLYREMACDKMTARKLKSDKWREISKKLYIMLFKEAEKYISGKKRLVISPHRSLNYLPFQVLTDREDKMLVEKYEITYLPSATILKYCQSKNTLKKDSFLAFELGNFKVDDLAPLPGTEKEVNSIAGFFPSKEILAGSDMNTDILYEKGGHYDILHFATHGILDHKSPLFSSLVFYDRRLPVYEIFDLDLKAYFVCLSACRTGIGEEASGDELVGLSRAFIYAGTPTICSSLWDVSDVSTSELMERFYYHLKDKNKSEALRLAQLGLMKKYGHPFFWAPFILTG